MEDYKVRFCFWKKISSAREYFKSLKLGEVESVRVGRRIFISPVNNENTPTELIQYDLDADTWSNLPVLGFHPATDGSHNIYLLALNTPDYRYQVIEYCLDTLTSTILDTTGIPPKKRRGPFSFFYYQASLYFFGGIQCFKADQTGSFVYKLDLESMEWNNIEYSGQFPASVPHGAMTGCRYGHSIYRYGHRVIVFGGTLIEESFMKSEYLTASMQDSM